MGNSMSLGFGRKSQVRAGPGGVGTTTDVAGGKLRLGGGGGGAGGPEFGSDAHQMRMQNKATSQAKMKARREIKKKKEGKKAEEEAPISDSSGDDNNEEVDMSPMEVIKISGKLHRKKERTLEFHDDKIEYKDESGNAKGSIPSRKIKHVARRESDGKFKLVTHPNFHDGGFEFIIESDQDFKRFKKIVKHLKRVKKNYRNKKDNNKDEKEDSSDSDENEDGNAGKSSDDEDDDAGEDNGGKGSDQSASKNEESGNVTHSAYKTE